MQILLAEHHLSLAKPLLRGLQEEGFQADLARDDAEANQQIHSTPYAALLVNWKLPRLGALPLVQTWRESGLLIPIFLLISSPSQEEIRQGLDAGANGFLPVPFPFSELLALLRQPVLSPPGKG